MNPPILTLTGLPRVGDTITVGLYNNGISDNGITYTFTRNVLKDTDLKIHRSKIDKLKNFYRICFPEVDLKTITNEQK